MTGTVPYQTKTVLYHNQYHTVPALNWTGYHKERYPINSLPNPYLWTKPDLLFLFDAR